ncbi:MAG TPA: DUF421 domain-containing protein [Mobilitalea sp.]|nr:DUF421 domain-containing protein [Mobilitalea sp.]
MIQQILKALLVTMIVYFSTLLLSRMLGRKLVSQMTFFDYIVGIMIGSAAVNATTFEDNPPLFASVMLVAICFLTLIIDMFHMKSIRLRKLIDSEPVIVIEKAKIVDKNMSKLRLTVEELNMMLRENGYFNISDVESAILESNGELSVQAKSEKQPLTPSDIFINPSYKGLTRDVVIDGKILENNLKFINKDEHWLKKQLTGYGVHDITDVFYAGMDSTGNFYVSKRQRNKEEAGMHGIE